MRGHVRKRGDRWAAVIYLGKQPCRQCPACRRKSWVRDEQLDVCPKCSTALPKAEEERRLLWLGGFVRRKDAEAAVSDRLGDVRRGTHVEPSDESLGEFLRQRWLPSLEAAVRAGNLKSSTLEGYRINVESYIVPRVGDIRLRDLGPERVDRLYADLLARGGRGGRPLRPKTVRNAHLCLHSALSTAVSWRLLPTNPTDGCKAVPKPEDRQHRERRMREQLWSRDELRAFLEHVREDRLYAAWLMLATTGMRRGELLGLRWEDVDLEERTATIVQTLTLVRHRPTISSAKSDAGARQLSLDAATVAALREHRRRQSEERLAWGPAWNDTGLAFTQEDGSLIHPERLLDWFRQRTKAAGLRPIRLHDLRHGYATALVQAGAHMKAISARLGHSSIGISMDLYSHAVRDLDQEAADLGAAFILGQENA